MKLTEITNEEYASLEEKNKQKVLHKNSTVEMLVDIFENEAYYKIKETLDTLDGLLNTQTICLSNQLQKITSEIYSLYLTCFPKKIVNKIRSEDITAFSSELINLQDRDDFFCIGPFLSAIINQHNSFKKPKEEYLLLINELNIPISGIAWKNTAHVRVIGNVGNSACYEMTGGSVNIIGNAEDYLGSNVCNGKIRVSGNCGVGCGWEMKNGEITIDGDVDSLIGARMIGGRININGEIDEYPHRLAYGTTGLIIYNEKTTTNKYGTIIHKGNVIFQKEKPLYKKIFWWLK